MPIIRGLSDMTINFSAKAKWETGETSSLRNKVIDLMLCMPKKWLALGSFLNLEINLIKNIESLMGNELVMMSPFLLVGSVFSVPLGPPHVSPVTRLDR